MSAPSPVPSYRPERPRSIFGPVVLTILGIVLLLCTTGRISWHDFWMGFAKYWPALLILWGIAKFVEYLWARQKGYPPPRLGAGSIVFLIFFILFGITTTRVAGINWSGVRSAIENDTDLDTFDIFGASHEYTQELTQPLLAATQIKIISSRGDITVSPSTDNQAHATIHKTLHNESEAAANSMNDATRARFQQQGTLWVMDLTGGDFERGRFNLDLQLPKNAALSISTRFGNVSVTGAKGSLDISTNHGDIDAEQIIGDASMRLRNGKVTAKNISGNVVLEGGSDTNISDIGGTLSMTGSFPGDIQLSHIAKPVHFATSRTELQFARLDGDLTMELDSLRAGGIHGPLKLQTRSKTVHLEDFSGDLQIQNSNATVEISPKTPLGNIDITNNRGEIDLNVPANAGFQLNAESRGGEIESDFDVNVTNAGNTAVANATVGKGGPTVKLKSDHGTIQIKKQ